jgi:hypothetical protein
MARSTRQAHIHTQQLSTYAEYTHTNTCTFASDKKTYTQVFTCIHDTRRHIHSSNAASPCDASERRHGDARGVYMQDAVAALRAYVSCVEIQRGRDHGDAVHRARRQHRHAREALDFLGHRWIGHVLGLQSPRGSGVTYCPRASLKDM